MNEWSDFFVAEIGASAALAGLIFVGISISLDEIVKYPHLVARAASALILLLASLVVGSVLLAPLASLDTAGYVVTGVGLVAWFAITILLMSGVRHAPPPHRRPAWIAMAMAQAAIIPIVIAGLTLVVSGTDGLYWVLLGFMLCFIVAVIDGWVLLIETHR